MTRLSMGLVLLATLYGERAFAETQTEIAARLNEEGKQLMFANPPRYAEASAKFQDAHSRVPEPKYFFNHCTSLYQEGKFGEALTACNAADKNADDKLKPKIAKMEERIRQSAKDQGMDLQAVGGGGGPTDIAQTTNGTPPPNTTGQPPPTQAMAVGRPPGVGIYTATAPENKYAWSLGADVYGGPGSMGREGSFGKAAYGLRIKGDYMLWPQQRFGGQVYLQWTGFGAPMGTENNLSVFDFGAAVYKHVCGPTSRFCFTPLAGVSIALMSPGNQMDATGNTVVFNYAAVGGRFEVGASYALGHRFEHVLNAALGVDLYTRAFSEPSDGEPASYWGLDRGGRAIYLSFGYTYRFSTPFGSTPFVTLE